jgi:hypothetical protein
MDNIAFPIRIAIFIVALNDPVLYVAYCFDRHIAYKVVKHRRANEQANGTISGHELGE